MESDHPHSTAPVIHRIHIRNTDQAIKELERIGVHHQGIRIMSPKAVFRPVKVYGLSPYQANVLKQEMLSLGGEAATSAGCINCSVEKSDIVLLGTLSHYERLADKLQSQPPSFHPLGPRILEAARGPLLPSSFEWRLPRRTIPISFQTLIMGIVNVTPDSFSDGGKYYDPEAAIKHALSLAGEGADILDIGGESTRPGSQPVGAEEEKRRVLPVLEALLGKVKIPVSIDTSKSEVAEAAIKRGAAIVNDVTALTADSNMAALCAEKKVGVILMHIKGAPETMQKDPCYEDVVGEVSDFFDDRMKAAHRAGIEKEAIVLDPGIGFGKNLAHNLSLIKAAPHFLARHRRPLLYGISRKRFIGELTGAPVGERLPGTLAAAVTCAMGGASIIRVHDVAATRDALRIFDALAALPS